MSSATHYFQYANGFELSGTLNVFQGDRRSKNQYYHVNEATFNHQKHYNRHASYDGEQVIYNGDFKGTNNLVGGTGNAIFGGKPSKNWLNFQYAKKEPATARPESPEYYSGDDEDQEPDRAWRRPLPPLRRPPQIANFSSPSPRNSEDRYIQARNQPVYQQRPRSRYIDRDQIVHEQSDEDQYDQADRSGNPSRRRSRGERGYVAEEQVPTARLTRMPKKGPKY
ncbi:hypothetical protein AX16_001513 [Volvariella volvacea WC 439]|nr:hypothetical protein AX16_001513 [Volvariella volvacea WC 439]